MKNPNIKTKLQHSHTKSAWNIVGIALGSKFKIARIPYIVTGNDKIDAINREEAFEYAEFINYCFNNSDKILTK